MIDMTEPPNLIDELRWLEDEFCTLSDQVKAEFCTNTAETRLMDSEQERAKVAIAQCILLVQRLQDDGK